MDARPEIAFGYVHGSVLNSKNARDVDVAVYLQEERFEALRKSGLLSLDFAIPFELELEKVLAEVVRTERLIRDGLFGQAAAPADLLTRAGNLMILPRRYESVSWYEKGRFEQKYYGHHGGLTRQEMLIPFVAVGM
jgi:hypothetical protein